MSNYKKISPVIFVIITTISSCLEQKMLFNPGSDINRNFLKKVPGFGAALYHKSRVIKNADSVDVYVCSFRERLIERNNLLESTELSDSSTIPAVGYLGMFGNSQDLYMLHYGFTYSVISKANKTLEVPADAVIFFSIKKDARGNVLAVRPCYFGIVNDEDSLVAFDTELTFKKNNDQFYLGPLKKIQNNYGLVFLPVNFYAGAQLPGSTFNIEKIVMFEKNKVGGSKPLLFNIEKIFHYRNALKFHYINTFHITP